VAYQLCTSTPGVDDAIPAFYIAEDKGSKWILFTKPYEAPPTLMLASSNHWDEDGADHFFAVQLGGSTLQHALIVTLPKDGIEGTWASTMNGGGTSNVSWKSHGDHYRPVVFGAAKKPECVRRMTTFPPLQ
jgi:hypothetical protein